MPKFPVTVLPKCRCCPKIATKIEGKWQQFCGYHLKAVEAAWPFDFPVDEEQEYYTKETALAKGLIKMKEE